MESQFQNRLNLINSLSFTANTNQVCFLSLRFQQSLTL